MPFYFRFGVGPFRFSSPLGRTKAQKRAARASAARRAKASAARRAARQERRRHAAWKREYNSPEAVALREDQASRTFNARISGCKIDGIYGGEFTIGTPPERPDVHIVVQPDMALQLLSLKNGDIVRVRVSADNTQIEEFVQLARANGATPRNAAIFPNGFTTA